MDTPMRKQITSIRHDPSSVSAEKIISDAFSYSENV